MTVYYGLIKLPYLPTQIITWKKSWIVWSLMSFYVTLRVSREGSIGSRDRVLNAILLEPIGVGLVGVLVCSSAWAAYHGLCSL